MIAFGTSMTDPEAYRRYAGPGVKRSAESDSEVFAFAAVGAISRGYNLLLDAAAKRDDLEALVLVQQEVELTDPQVCEKIRAALSDPEVGAVSCAGATGVRSIAWWEGSVSAADVSLAYHEHGGGRMPAFGWVETSPAPADVETLDGSLLVLSPWAVRNVRFDERLWLGHGSDLDYCLQLREHGRTLRTADIAATYHRPLKLVDDHDLWIEAHMHVAAKWDGRMPGAQPDERSWKERARRAEADREGARTIAYSTTSLMDARALPLERELEALERSPSWRLTRPLRLLNRWRARAAGRQA